MTVATLISQAQGYASSISSDAHSAMQDAANSIQAIGYSIPNFNPVSLPSAPPLEASLEFPTLDTVTLDLPVEPTGSLVFQDISAFEPGVAPTLAASLPTLSTPTEPSALAQFTGVAPSVETSIAFPSPPAELLNPLIQAPALTERAEPNKPQTMLPVFGATAPLDNTAAPTDLEDRFDTAYRNATPGTVAMLDGYVDAMLTKFNPRFNDQMTAIEKQIDAYMAGGTGLKTEVEEAIYSRARERNDAEARRLSDAAYNETAARGFTIPTGAVNAQIQRIRQDAATANNKTSNEIIVMQAEMEQKNLQFAVTTSAGLRTTMLNAALSYHQNLIGINGQALDYAKTLLSSIIEVYNTAVKAYGLKLDAYRAEAAVFETKLKSAMAGMELYRMEIAALEALSNVDRAKVDVYRARIESLTALSNVYRAQIDAVTGRVSLEKLKLDVFQTQVQSYSALVQAKNAEWQGYSAAMEGQTAKVKIYSSQVDAYNSQVNGYKATIEARSEVVRAQAATNRARADQYTATLNGYQTIVQARGDKARTQLENQRQTVIAFQARTQATVANAQVRNEYYKSVSMVGIANAELQMKAMLGEIDSRRNFSQTIAQLSSANGQVYAGLAQAAMAGMNTLASEIKNE